uniref:Uncharacterized protein n=1 Tax=Leersia perrieri TaxID=77586 RepID=A0A0D9WX59_9ORYZ
MQNGGCPDGQAVTWWGPSAPTLERLPRLREIGDGGGRRKPTAEGEKAKPVSHPQRLEVRHKLIQPLFIFARVVLVPGIAQSREGERVLRSRAFRHKRERRNAELGRRPAMRRSSGACAVVDGQWYAAITAAAADVGVATLALHTDSAATLHCMLSYSRLCSAGGLPIKAALRIRYLIDHAKETRDEVVPTVEPLSGHDMIRVVGSDAARVREFIARVDNAMRTAAVGVVLNTFGAISGVSPSGRCTGCSA